MATDATTKDATPVVQKRSERSLESIPWLRLAPLLGLVLSVTVSAIYGFPTGLIAIGATVMLVGIWNLWTSLQILAGDLPDDLPGETTAAKRQVPSHEQEQKAYLLRALEDLEFERSVGKIDDDDYQALRQRYRAQAKQALAADSDAKSPSRKRAETLASAYLERKGLKRAESAPPAPASPIGKTEEEGMTS